MSALLSRSPGGLQLPINKDFVSSARSSAIYTPKRKGFSSLNVKKVRSHGNASWEDAKVQPYTPKVAVVRALWNLST